MIPWSFTLRTRWFNINYPFDLRWEHGCETAEKYTRISNFSQHEYCYSTIQMYLWYNVQIHTCIHTYAFNRLMWDLLRIAPNYNPHNDEQLAHLLFYLKCKLHDLFSCVCIIDYQEFGGILKNHDPLSPHGNILWLCMKQARQHKEACLLCTSICGLNELKKWIAAWESNFLIVEMAGLHTTKLIGMYSET